MLFRSFARQTGRPKHLYPYALGRKVKRHGLHEYKVTPDFCVQYHSNFILRREGSTNSRQAKHLILLQLGERSRHERHTTRHFQGLGECQVYQQRGIFPDGRRQFRETVGMEDMGFDFRRNPPDTLRDIPEIFGVAAWKSHGEEEGLGRQKHGGTFCEQGGRRKVYKGQPKDTRRLSILGLVSTFRAWTGTHSCFGGSFPAGINRGILAPRDQLTPRRFA